MFAEQAPIKRTAVQSPLYPGILLDQTKRYPVEVPRSYVFVDPYDFRDRNRVLVMAVNG